MSNENIKKKMKHTQSMNTVTTTMDDYILLECIAVLNFKSHYLVKAFLFVQ